MRLNLACSASRQTVLRMKQTFGFSCGKTGLAVHPSSSLAPSEKTFHKPEWHVICAVWNKHNSEILNIINQTWILSPEALRTTTPPCLKRRSAVSASVTTTYPILTCRQVVVFSQISLSVTCLDPNFSWFLSSHAWYTISLIGTNNNQMSKLQFKNTP